MKRDPTRALQRVQITDLSNPGDRLLPGLLNPSSLSYSIDVGIGELNPVGWPSSVLNYGHTKSPQLPLEFYFTTQLTPRAHPGANLDLTYYVDWFNSFIYPTELGGANPVMLVVWPNTFSMAVVVASFNAEYNRFHQEDLAPGAVRVVLSARELRFSPRTSSSHRTHGMHTVDPLISSGGLTGPPLNLKGK